MLFTVLRAIFKYHFLYCYNINFFAKCLLLIHRDYYIKDNKMIQKLNID